MWAWAGGVVNHAEGFPYLSHVLMAVWASGVSGSGANSRVAEALSSLARIGSAATQLGPLMQLCAHGSSLDDAPRALFLAQA